MKSLLAVEPVIGAKTKAVANHSRGLRSCLFAS